MKRNRHTTLFGFEIEAVHDTSDFIDENKQEYHSGESRVTKYFKLESDSSIEDNGNTEWETCTEFISIPFKRKELKKVLKDLASYCFDINLTEDFKGTHFPFHFNSSCGCHMNFSFLRNGKSLQISKFSLLKRIGRIMQKEFGNSFVGQYNRYYAEPVSEKDFCIGERYGEFHKRGDYDYIEFRAFNLKGVRSWGSMYKRMNRAMQIVEEELRKELKRKQVMLKTRKVYVPAKKEHEKVTYVFKKTDSEMTYTTFSNSEVPCGIFSGTF